MRKLSQTKRARSTVIQSWLDPQSAEDAEVLRAVDAIRKKHSGMSTKAIIDQAVLFSARQDGIEVERPVSMLQIAQMFKSILQKMDGLVAGGQLSHQDASSVVELAQAQGLRFEDLDPVAQSLARNYVGFSLNEDEDDG